MDKARLAYSFTEAETQYIQHSAELPWLNKTYQLSSGLLIAIGLAILLHFLLKNSKWGYENKISGLNIIFARFSGMPILKIAASAMFVSGLLSGLTGAVLVMGDYHRFLAQFSINLGMDGITAALMGNLNPLGTLLSSFFMAILKNGGAAMELKVNVPYDLVTVVQASVLLFITSTRLLEYLKIKKVEHKED